jgi:hypothetical protein
MDIVMPWPPLIILLIFSFFALYAGLLLCQVEKPVTHKVALAALIPWILGVVVAFVGEASSMSGSGPFWAWVSVFTAFGYVLVQLLIIWKFLKVKLSRAFLVLLAWGAIIVLFAALIVLYVRLTESN